MQSGSKVAGTTCNLAIRSQSLPLHVSKMMRQHQDNQKSERPSWTHDRGMHRPLSSRASSATLRNSQHPPFNFLNSRGEQTDVNIANELLKEEAQNHPRRRSPFNISPLPESRTFLMGTDGPSDVPQHAIDHERNRNNRNTSNTWTDSSLGSEAEDEEDRHEFVKEYNRLAEKHGVRKIIPDGYESTDTDNVTFIGKHGSWIVRKLLRRTSSTQTLKLKGDNKQVRHKRSVSDFSNRLRIRREPLKDKTLKELVDICGRSLLYLPSEYAAASLTLPTCLRATAHYIVQHGIATRGIFRIPGANSSTLNLYNYYATLDECADELCGTVRAPTLPEHLSYEAHDVASVFKKFLSGLPGGILQGSINIFEALIGIQSHLNSDPEWTRTKQSKVRARLIALAIGSIRSRLQRELICAVFGLLCMIGRAAELAPREDDRGRPLPTSGLMGYGALGIVFGPLLLGEALDSYEMRFAPGGVIVFPVTTTPLQKESRKITTHKKGSFDDLSYAASRFDKVKVANGITEMLIIHWRDVVRHMKSLGILKTCKDHGSVLNRERGRTHLRPCASEMFTLRNPPEWGDNATSILRGQQTPSPVTPLQRRISQSDTGPVNPHGDYLRIRKQRNRPVPPIAPVLSGSKSMGTLSPMAEETTIEDETGKFPVESLFPNPLQAPRSPYRNRASSNPALRDAIERLKTPPAKGTNTSPTTEASNLLAEVARELRGNAQKLLGTQLDQRGPDVTIAELPCPSEGNGSPQGKNVDDTVSPDVNTATEDSPEPFVEAAPENPSHSPPQQKSSGSSKKIDALLEESRQDATLDQVTPPPKSSPRSKARDFFEGANRDSPTSKVARGHQQQGKTDSPGRRFPLSRIRQWNKGEDATVPPIVVEAPLVLSSEQPEAIAPALPPKNIARRYLESVDQQGSSGATKNRENTKTASSPSLARSTAKEEFEPKRHSPARFHNTRPDSPLRSEVQRSPTPESADGAQDCSGPQVQVDPPVARTPSLSIMDRKRGEKLDSPESPHRRAFLRFEKWNQHSGSNAAEDRTSPENPRIPQIPRKRPQGLVSSRIRGLVSSDPGRKTPELSEIEASPNLDQPGSHFAQQRQVKSESATTQTFSAKDDLERVSQEDDLASLSVLAEALRSEVQDTSPIPERGSNQNSPETPFYPDETQMPVTSVTGSLEHEENSQLSHVDENTGIVEDAPKEPEEKVPVVLDRPKVPERPKIPERRPTRSSDERRSDASNITVILIPKRRSRGTDRSIRSSPRSSSSITETIVTTSCDPMAQALSALTPLAADVSPVDSAEVSNEAAAASPVHMSPEEPFSELRRDFRDTTNMDSVPAPQSPGAQPEDRKLPGRAPKGPAGSVMALAARFNNPEPLSPAPSPVKKIAKLPRGIIRHSLFTPADRLVSNYTTNSPSPTKTTYPERSDLRTVRNPLPADRHPDAQVQTSPKEVNPVPADRSPRAHVLKTPQKETGTLPEDRDPLHKTPQKAKSPALEDQRPDPHSHFHAYKTPQKEISPIYRTPRNIAPKESASPSPFSFSKTPPNPLNKRTPVDGNDSQSHTSTDTRTPNLRRSNTRIHDNRSPVLRTIANHSPGIRESLGSRTSSVGTILPHPVEPPVDQHVSFVRPPSTPRHMEQKHKPGDGNETIRIVTPSGNAALYEQIRKLQKQLDIAKEEVGAYKRRVEERGEVQDLGTLSEQLRESKRETRAWRARAELAERRLVMLEGIKGKGRPVSPEKAPERYPGAEYQGHGDGPRDDRFSISEVSTTAVFNENKVGCGGNVQKRMHGRDTECATRSTDTDIWVRGGTATILNGTDDSVDEVSRQSGQREMTGSFDHACEEKIVIGQMVLGMRSTSESDRGRDNGVLVSVVDGRERFRGKRVVGAGGDGAFGSEWSLLGELCELE